MIADCEAQTIELGTVDLIEELRWKAHKAFRMAVVLREVDQDTAGWWVSEAFRLTNHADELAYLMRKYLELCEESERWARVAASPIDFVNEILKNRKP